MTIAHGQVYSETALNHSVNYRSVVAFCRASASQPSIEQSRTLLQAMIARYWNGRTVGADYAVIPEKHLETTAMVALDIEASARDSAQAVPPSSVGANLAPGE